jgi:hypothetical protein
MRASTPALALSWFCLVATTGWAQGEPPVAPSTSPSQRRNTGVEVEFRTGYGVPAGRATGDPRGALSDRFTGIVPIVFGLGYRIHRRASVGVFFQSGPSFVNGEPGAWTEQCSHYEYSCSSSVLRWGAGARIHLMPDQRVDPWLGAGMGYEKMSLDGYFYDGMGGRTESHWTASGLEFVNLDAGADFRMLSAFAIGAYVTVTVAHYSHQTQFYPIAGQRSPGGGRTDVSGDAIHEWIMFGLRLSYLFGT